jgi:hypothetical protein
MDTGVTLLKPPVTSKPTDVRQLAFRIHGSNCGNSSTATLYVSQQYCFISTVKRAAGWSAASPAALLLWFIDGVQNSPGAAAIAHPQACRTPLRAKFTTGCATSTASLLAMLPCMCTVLRAVNSLLAIIMRTYCPAYIRHTWSSEVQLLHDRPGNPWLALLNLFTSEVQHFRLLIVFVLPVLLPAAPMHAADATRQQTPLPAASLFAALG